MCVELAARLAVGLRRIPADAAGEAAQARDELGQIANGDLESGADVHRVGRVVALGREQDSLGRVARVQELARRRAVAPGDDLRVAALLPFDALATQRG